MRGVKRALVILAFLLLIILFAVLLRDEQEKKTDEAGRLPDTTEAETEAIVGGALEFPVGDVTLTDGGEEVPEKERIGLLAEIFLADFAKSLQSGDTEELFLGLGTEKLYARTGKTVDRDGFARELEELNERIPDGIPEIGKLSLLSDENGTFALVNVAYCGKEDRFLAADREKERDMVFVLGLDREMTVESWYLLEMTDGRYGAY